MSGRLAGKIAIVTGGTSGIGEATVRLFVREGSRVVVVARRPEPGHKLVAELDPALTRFLAGDVTVEATARTAVDLAESWGGLDILVNNAAMDWSGPILSASAAEVERVFETNFLGSFLMQRDAAARMIARGGGSIINVTSRNALVGVAGLSVYAAAKGALLSLTRAAAIEWARQGVRVNAVAPGLTLTPLVRAWIDAQDDPVNFEKEVISTIPQGRMAEPKEIAAAILFLASDEARHVTGISLAVDGGYTAA